MRFTDRRDAGRRLAPRVAALNLTDPVVLALPRGGVPVAAPIAEHLSAPLEVFVARKVGLPEQPEFGIGAIAEGLAEPVVYADAPRIRERTWRELTAQAQTELDRRVARYRGERALPPLAGTDVVLVDDGLATGVTAEAAVRGVRTYSPSRVVLAVPVAAPDTAERLSDQVDDLVALLMPRHFQAVGLWYEDYRQTEDDEVLALLTGAAS